MLWYDTSTTQMFKIWDDEACLLCKYADNFATREYFLSIELNSLCCKKN